MKQWILNGVFKADVNKVDAEIKSIGDYVTPEDLVKYAKKNKKSELHKCFEWDDTKAAEKYRLRQAQKVLTFIVDVPEKAKEPSIREYSLVKPGKSEYAPTRMFLVNQDEYKDLLNQALMELKAFERKYKNLTELDAVFAAIDEI